MDVIKAYLNSFTLIRFETILKRFGFFVWYGHDLNPDILFYYFVYIRKRCPIRSYTEGRPRNIPPDISPP